MGKDVKEVRELAMQISGGKSAGSRKSQCKGPEVGACLGYLRSSGEAIVAGSESRRERGS